MHRFLAASVAACLAIGSGCPAALGQPVSPAHAPAVSANADDLFPSAAEVADVLGVEVEAGGIREDLGQWWEGIDLDPAVLESARTQNYRSVESQTSEPWTGVIVEIVRFQTESDATGYGAQVAAITTPLETFETDLVADLTATGSWLSDEGFAGSIIVVRDGPVLVTVTAARTGVERMRDASTTLTALVLDRLHGIGER